ncbi:VanZ like protein [Fontibacillus phaseoli]|uniref:VanZ like protein n=1 Tax=Fontibacillus phaseoli TaxID=1416533 RepID=A0A369B8B2_9BACL|nr:VanZ family protein [Fontibacillus phaseoli]RCX17661.1 VanZ like protein [Fontibacillus phaseoli]
MNTQQRKLVFSITVLYTMLILYFIFFAFGRTGTVEHMTGYTFIFLPDNFYKLPSVSDLLHPTLMDFVGFGNTVAFIPFGILIPMLYRTRFIRFISLFFLSILVVETIQALTLLGSFDMNDAIQNSLGAAVGFGAYKFGVRTNNVWRNMITIGVSMIVLLAGLWVACGLVDKAFTKHEGPVVALNELKDSSGDTSTGTDLYSFKIGGQNIEPQHNVFSAGGKKVETYTYALGKKQLVLSGYYGIPDDPSGDFSGSISISVDGHELLSNSEEYQRREPEKFEIPLESAGELSITLEGNEQLWDIGFREMKYFWN